MSEESSIPNWVRGAQRVDRPQIDAWYKLDDGAIDGVLIWRGQQEGSMFGDGYNAYAIRLSSTGTVLGVSERAGLRGLRSVRVGSRVFIRPTTSKTLDNGRKMQQFEIFADHQEPLSDPPKNSAAKGADIGSDGEPASSEKVPF